MLSADWSDGVRWGPIGSDWVISHTALECESSRERIGQSPIGRPGAKRL